MTKTALPRQLSDSVDAPDQTPQANKTNIDPNTIILADALTDSAISWRIHNCKISKKSVTQDVPMLFLYHYDSLDEAIKATNPLTPKLLAQFNTPMMPDDAAKLMGIDPSLIKAPWHVKVTGSLVVFSEALQLAVRLHWTNTGKASQPIYTKDAKEALAAAIIDWQFFGRVDVLYKNDKQALISTSEQTVSEKTDSEQAADEAIIMLPAMLDYQLLPPAHALSVIAKLEAEKTDLPWFEAAILERLE